MRNASTPASRNDAASCVKVTIFVVNESIFPEH